MVAVPAQKNELAPDKWRALAAERFRDLPLDCGRRTDPGVMQGEAWRDWSRFETTPDQLRIEDYLDLHDLRGRSILHIGLGNSGLAVRFHKRAREIVGTSIIPAEVEKARALGLPNYRAVLHNKYTGRAEDWADRFDFIVDNGPTTFCCCLSHLATMLEFYVASLGVGGQVVTDRVGLAWTDIPGGNPRWSFDLDDLAAAGEVVGLRASRVDRNIYVLSRNDVEPLPPSTGLKLLARSIGRRLARALR
jgi:hypothetical protein